MQFRQTLSPDRGSMRLEGVEDGRAVFSTNLNAVNVEELISQLGRMRAEMQPETPRVLAPPITSVAYSIDPVWRITADSPQGRPLFLRHDWFGWCGFVFPQHEASNISHWLVAKIP